LKLDTTIVNKDHVYEQDVTETYSALVTDLLTLDEILTLARGALDKALAGGAHRRTHMAKALTLMKLAIQKTKT
jgi:hypothetical protein